jgi:gluconokinase
MEPHTLVVMGVSGSGKSTLAQGLADTLGWPFQEGDDLHPAANIAKMSAGIPLTDDDRAPWLDRVAAWIDSHPTGIVTCSALKRSYRDRLRRPGVIFVLPDVPRAVLQERLAHRSGHFMPASLLDSQLDTLEPLGPDEAAIVVDATQGPETTLAEVLSQLR